MTNNTQAVTTPPSGVKLSTKVRIIAVAVGLIGGGAWGAIFAFQANRPHALVSISCSGEQPATFSNVSVIKDNGAYEVHQDRVSGPLVRKFPAEDCKYDILKK